MKNCNRFKLYVFFVVYVPGIQCLGCLFIGGVETRMQKQLEIFPQENIYIHNDKPVYLSDDKIQDNKI